MPNILVVGGAGYVGGYLTDYAISSGYTVRVLDNLTYEDIYLKDIDFEFCDILKFKTLVPHLKWADVVIWLVGIVGDQACSINPKLTMDINVNSVRNLIDNFSGRIIFPSTCSVYGAQNSLLNENSPVSPLSLYAETKLQAEEILNSAHGSVLIFRLGTLFGLSDFYSRLRVDLVLNALTIRGALEGKLSVFGGNQYRPLLHVKDVGRTMVENIKSKQTGIFNLHAENLSILELANRIASIIPNTEIEQSMMSFQDARNYRVSSQKAIEGLDFSPIYTVDQGILEIFELIKSKRIKDVSIPRFTNLEIIKISNSKEEK